MNKAICVFILLFLYTVYSFSQIKSVDNTFTFKKKSTSDGSNSIILGSLLVVTPTLVIEGGKSHFGLSKEISLGKYPYGRAELDYTYVFRNELNSLAHISYNLDIPTNFNFSYPSMFMVSPGAGYYTDFTRKGFFVQIALGLWASTGFSDAISIHPNIKFRKVFMQDNYPGVFEISVGVGFGIYTR